MLDADEPRPGLRIATAGAKAILAWPTNRAGFLLERATALPATNWNPDTNLRGSGGPAFNVTNSLSRSNLCFRLRAL